MAAPSYTTDLTQYGSVTSTTGWAEATNMTSTDGSGEVDSDLAIYGTQCISEAQRKSGLGSLVYTGTAPTWTSGWAYFIWYKFFAPNSLATKSNGGIRVVVGSSSSNYRGWYANGSDTYSKGGWKNYVVDPEQTALASQTQGTPTTTYNTLGIGASLLNGISKGNSHTIDIMRYGRGETRFTGGDLANGYAVFSGWSSIDDNQTTGRYGLFSDQGGSYLWKGLMSLGLTGTSVDMRDANVNISIDNTEFVDPSFNRIEVHNASSNIEWDSVNITSLSTRSPGEFEMVDNATVSMTACAFQNMSTFIFDTNATVTLCAFNGCDQITHGGAEFFGTSFKDYEGTAGTAYLLYASTTDPDGELDECSFTKGTAATHAIEFDATNTPTTITLRNIDFSGYNSSNGNNDSALYFPSTSKSYTVNLVGCTGNISYRVGTGGSVTLVADPVTTKITVKDADTQALLQNARVLAWVTDGTNFPYLDSVTITGSGTTATVTHTAHGLATNDSVWIQGANQENYVGAYDITVTGVNTYTYTTAETIITSPATGTITSTFCFLNGDTNSSGVISDSRVVSSDQPFSYRVRKSTTPGELYKQATGSDIVDSVNGISITANLVSDE